MWGANVGCHWGYRGAMKTRPFVALLICAAALTVMTAQPAEAATVTYKNCTALNKHYPHGVGKSGAHDRVSGSSKPVTNFTRSTATYRANAKSDRDKDGIACEKR